ncbi:MAG: dynamin family protein [Burkholderiales bacterium]|nr:dynamin family protein [Burkholderiales bacterium]
MTKAAITHRLADLQSWRYGLDSQISRVLEFLRTHEFLTSNLEAALREASTLVANERVTITFVAEIARGKSELINGLFFADLGRRFLPSGPGKSTRCVTELRFNRNVRTGLKLLPIETRESPKRLTELLDDESQWRVIFFDADNPDSIARAFAALSETKRITLTDAVAWGLHGEGIAVPVTDSPSAMVDVPRWRYAVVNFPHPLLDAGLVIIDTPGLAALSLEPELSRERVPNSDALIMVFDITQGVAKSDLAMWKGYLGNASSYRERMLGNATDESKQMRLVVLNKIDALEVPPHADPIETNRELLREIDRRVRTAADLLRVDPMRVVAVSARQGLMGKLGNDNDQAVKSRLYHLARNLGSNLPKNRQATLTTDILSTLSNALEAAQSVLDSQRFDTLEGLNRLSIVREKNEKLMRSVVVQAGARHDQLDAALKEVRATKVIHARLSEELAAVVDVGAARYEADRAKAAITGSLLSANTVDAVKKYFALVAEKLAAMEVKIEEVRELFKTIGDSMRDEFALGKYEVHPFPTQRFHTELQKARVKSDTEFTKTSNLLVRRGGLLAEQFEELVINRVMQIFTIANRESATWMRGLYTSLETPLVELREQTKQRVGSIEQIKVAELDLAERIAELQARMDMLKKKHSALADARNVLERFAEKCAEETA